MQLFFFAFRVMNNGLPDRKERTLFVSTIHKSVTDDDLYEILSQAGPVEKIVFKERSDGTPMHAVVVFRNVESVVFSMLHISPIVQKCGLIRFRPLRESSHGNLSSSATDSHCRPADDILSPDALYPLKWLNDFISWNGQPLPLFHSHDRRKLPSFDSSDAACVGHNSLLHSVISELCPSNGLFLCQNLPFCYNPIVGHLGFSHLYSEHSPTCFGFPLL
ncbi:hypothetical protein KIN20_025551 [Parelaphostrongylus tenuis]|uniref:RRM domain-containing protein n=1 Tax=Parelaphostrongylus tenuis TaxID=148309 RepID=A0AAD5NDE1_PARTN|nr:hypothetical protein KIN20_025551 [Parelaphostrongylus tenuis]